MLDIVKSLLTGVKDNHKSEIISNCPFCNKEKHFYINKTTFRFDCKKCGETGGIKKFLHHFGKSYLIGEKVVNVSFKAKGINEAESIEELDLTTKKVLLPIGYKRIYENEYLETKRGFTELDFLHYQVGKTKTIKKYVHYAIFPIYENKICVGFVGRCDSNSKDLGRYNNSIGTKFNRLFYGYDDINLNHDTVMLVEGLFDKRRMDKYFKLKGITNVVCLATFGKKISEYQIAKLKKFKQIQVVIICWDYDAVKEMKKYAFELKKFWNILLTYTFLKDVDECNDLEVESIFDKLQEPTEFFMKNLLKI